MTDTTVFRVGDWLVEPEFDRLTRNDAHHKVEPKTMAVLVELLRRPGHVVATDELIQGVWNGRPMGDNPVYKCISRLREVFGDTATNPTYIGTVPRKGYRFLVTVEVVDNAASKAFAFTDVDDDRIIGRNPLRHNLRARNTRFIGRECQIRELESHLAHSRLVTLVGPGGCGKTRLAVETAGLIGGNYKDGVFLVELAGLTEPDLIADEVADVLGLATHQTGDTMTALLAHLHRHSVLIVLDNCEHVIGAAADVANALTTRTAGVIVLVTSREALRVEGEVVYKVPSLNLPDRRARPDHLQNSEAIQLFADRATLAKPDLRLTGANLPAVADICRHLDGVPLAIELAAAQVQTFSLTQIASHLDAALQLLTGGSRVSPRRQRSLRAAIEWSYDLLSQEEKTLFHRLAAFAGSFKLDSVSRVCGPWDSGDYEILHVFSRLTEKSLIGAADDDRGGYRYRLQPVVRQFALEKLDKDTVAELRDRHFTYYFDLARDGHEGFLVGRRPAEWYRTLTEEHDNLRSALAWSLSQPNCERGAEFVVFLAPFWSTRAGLLDEGRRWVEAALSAVGPEPELRRRLRNKLAGLQFLLGDLQSAGETAKSIAHECQIAGDDMQLTKSLVTLSLCSQGAGNFTLASQYLEQILDLTRRNNDLAASGWALGGLAEMRVQQGRLDDALSYYRQGLSAAQESGYRRSETQILEGMSLLEWRLGNLEAATELALDGLSIAKDIGYDLHAGLHQFNLGLIANSRKDFKRAGELLTDGLTTIRSARVPALLPEQLEGMAAAAHDRGDVYYAATLLGAIESWCRLTGKPVNRRWPSDQFTASLTASTDSRIRRRLENGRMMTLDEAVDFAISRLS